MSPDPELYDLAEDPGETINLAVTEKDLYESLEATADQFIDEIGEGGTSGEFMAVDEDTLAKLASLGYIGSFVPTEEESVEELASPREKIGIYNKSIQARQRMHTEKYEEAEELLIRIQERSPGSDVAERASITLTPSLSLPGSGGPGARCAPTIDYWGSPMIRPGPVRSTSFTAHKPVFQSVKKMWPLKGCCPQTNGALAMNPSGSTGTNMAISRPCL